MKLSKRAKDLIERKTGVKWNTICFRCGKTAEQSFNLGPVLTGINHPEYYQTCSFYGYAERGKACPRCHREMMLEGLFNLMDARDKKRNKN